MKTEILNQQSINKASESQALFQKLVAWFKQDMAHVSVWRARAREDYAFYSGDQWTPEDAALLQGQKRPVMTFNRVAPLVNAVIGAEINNRRQVRYIPREAGDVLANEILTGAGEWFRDQAQAEDEESEAFADTVIGGMGWIDTRLDFETNPDGDPVVARLDPFKMVWDRGAVKANLSDASRLWYVDEKPQEEVQAMFPDIDPLLLHADWASHLGDDPVLDRGAGHGGGETQKMCTLVECRWCERETFFRAPDLASGAMREYSHDEMDVLLQKFPSLVHVRQTRKIVRRAFLGRTLLAAPDRPLTPPGQFGWECITGYFDRISRHFYGIVRPTKDPQRWANKFFSQVMYLLNAQAKGGIMAERGAFDDDAQAETSLARADQITWVKNGALSAGAGRIQPKPVAQFPSGFFALFNESKEAISQVTGLSPEFIGTRGANQAGVLEAQRRQSSLNLLASLYNALRRYRKRQGLIVLYLLQNHLSDGRLIRIMGEEKSHYVPFTREQFAHHDYDIIVDDAPTSPNEKERTFAIMNQILPMIRDYLTPEMGLEILRYSPLPSSLVSKWERLVTKENQNIQT